VAATAMVVMTTILCAKFQSCCKLFARGEKASLLGATNVECPKEKKVPTVADCWPVATSRLVIRSIAWS
jgi:hypothetical protein